MFLELDKPIWLISFCRQSLGEGREGWHPASWEMVLIHHSPVINMLATSLLVLEKKKITPITSTESNLSTNRNQNRNSSNLERASLRQKAKS